MSSHPRHRAATSSFDDAAPPGERVGHGERGVGTAARTVEPPDPTDLAVDLQGIHKSFGKAHVLNGVDLQIPRGVIAGFLGPNGSGKSTTIRILLGLLRADSGTATVLGRDAWRDAVEAHRHLAYVPGDVNLWPGLTGGECIDLLCRMRGGTRDGAVEELIERFQLDPRKKARAYSKGNRQKVALIAALASDAELLVLDEPTSGLDPLMEREFQDVVRQRRAEGVSVLLSSHILSEVEQLCDTVAIIREGTVVEQGRLEDMRHLTRVTIEVITANDPGLLGDTASLHGLQVHEMAEGFHITGQVEPSALQGMLPGLHSLHVRQLHVTPASLEELFMRHYRADPHGEAAQATGAGDVVGVATRTPGKPAEPDPS